MNIQYKCMKHVFDIVLDVSIVPIWKFRPLGQGDAHLDLKGAKAAGGMADVPTSRAMPVLDVTTYLILVLSQLVSILLCLFHVQTVFLF